MILDTILKHKRKEVAVSKKRLALSALKKEVLFLPEERPRFLKALEASRGIAVIAEIKRKSPSKGILRKNFDPCAIALDYERGGASALSVLTDEKFFGGSSQILKKVRVVTRLPILRKDFIIDEYQIWESRRIGADAVLLLAGVLSTAKIHQFSALASRLGLDALVEVHTEGEARKALSVKAPLVGINNRDLRDFRVDLATTKRLAGLFSKKVCLVSESGIQSRKDLVYLRACGAQAVLVGESLMKRPSPGAALKALLGASRG